METTTCPECGAPAEILDRATLESTDGPIEHVKLTCVRRHWFLMSTGSLASARRRAADAPAPRSAPTPRGPAHRRR